MMKVCEVCGATSDNRKVCYRKKYNMCLCNKHYLQLYNKNRITDNNPKGIHDNNEYRIHENIIEVDCYNSDGSISGTFITDIQFLDLIQKYKWRLTRKGRLLYAVTCVSHNPIKHVYFHRMITEAKSNEEIDHIDGNSLNNCLCNLRKGSHQDNLCNMSAKKENKFGIRGISYDKKQDVYAVDFTCRKKHVYTKGRKKLAEAVYQRYCLEILTNPLQRHNRLMDKYIETLTNEQKNDIMEYVKSKI